MSFATDLYHPRNATTWHANTDGNNFFIYLAFWLHVSQVTDTPNFQCFSLNQLNSHTHNLSIPHSMHCCNSNEVTVGSFIVWSTKKLNRATESQLALRCWISWISLTHWHNSLQQHKPLVWIIAVCEEMYNYDCKAIICMLHENNRNQTGYGKKLNQLVQMVILGTPTFI